MKSIFSTLWLLLTVTISGYAQTHQKTPQGLKTTVRGNEIEVQFYSPEIVRIIKNPKGQNIKKESLSVIMKPEKTSFMVEEDGGELTLRTKKITVIIDMNTATVAFKNSNGAHLITEKVNSVHFSPFNDNGESTYTVSQSFVLEQDEPIYGLGQHQRGNLSQRNQSYRLEQGNLDDVVPFFQSVKGYGIFWDNYSATDFRDANNETSFTSDVGDCVDYYFMCGSNADAVIGAMRTLTGKAPMFPLWTFGFWQSRERYRSQEEVLDVVKRYRKLGVPLDGIIQDWQYWGGNYLWNAMEFLNPDFPTPQAMVDDVHKLNAHLIISIWSSFGPKTKPFRELSNKNMLLEFTTWPESGSEKWPPNPDYPSGVLAYDPYNPEARDIYWKYVNNGLFSKGIDGWWMDSTEPDHLQIKPSDYDNKTYLGSFRKVRNAYPLMSVGGVYTHQRRTSEDKRVFILTRSAFAGQQRYGANTWSGDIQSSWETLKNQVPTGLNFSLSAIPYWNSDIGGFFLHNFKNALKDPNYRELYARWMQFGTFCPMMRSHGTDAPREIYQFGEKGDKVYDAVEKYIRLRYTLLPYIYAVSHEVTSENSSMMRALFMDFAHDKKTWDNNEQYIFGKSLLVNPVTTPMYVKEKIGNPTEMIEDFSAVKSKQTYLPTGCDWYDFWTNEKFKGGNTIEKQTPLDIIPVYVKAGAILPLGPDVQFATEKKWDTLKINVYPGTDGSFTLYEDEFDNYNYEKGAYSKIEFCWNNHSKKLTIAKRSGNFTGMLQSRTFIIVLPDGQNKTVKYSGKKTEVKF